MQEIVLAVQFHLLSKPESECNVVLSNLLVKLLIFFPEFFQHSLNIFHLFYLLLFKFGINRSEFYKTAPSDPNNNQPNLAYYVWRRRC